MSSLKYTLALVAAFTIGALLTEVHNLRKWSDLRVNQAAEEAYWRGFNEGQEAVIPLSPTLEGL